ncbi:hypothetical protein DFH09DRAFT_1339589 [Mycena vulgaris]|nr:hypothetical protein DFH09DRAFT_1339589 [Mycena vulgaris]
MPNRRCLTFGAEFEDAPNILHLGNCLLVAGPTFQSPHNDLSSALARIDVMRIGPPHGFTGDVIQLSIWGMCQYPHDQNSAPCTFLGSGYAISEIEEIRSWSRGLAIQPFILCLNAVALALLPLFTFIAFIINIVFYVNISRLFAEHEKRSPVHSTIIPSSAIWLTFVSMILILLGGGTAKHFPFEKGLAASLPVTSPQRRHGLSPDQRREGGIFGVVKAYYGRVEAQGRGSLHCHTMIWIDGALEVKAMENGGNSEFQRRLISFPDDTISTAVPPEPAPDPETPPLTFPPVFQQWSRTWN